MDGVIQEGHQCTVGWRQRIKALSREAVNSFAWTVCVLCAVLHRSQHSTTAHTSQLCPTTEIEFSPPSQKYLIFTQDYQYTILNTVACVFYI